MDKPPIIFLSYCWKNITIADEIDKDFQNIGFFLKRDIRDAEYRQSLKLFMQSIKDADFVIMLISNDFLKSENCMYEVMELLNMRVLEKKILPISTGDANIYSSDGKTKYYDFWDSEIKKTKILLKKYLTSDLSEQLKHQNNIRNMLPDFFLKLTDLNTKTFSQIKSSGYEDIFKATKISNKHLIINLTKIELLPTVEEKEIALEKLSNQNGANYLISFVKGRVAKQAKQYNKARFFYEESISLNNNYENSHNDFGVLLSGNFNEFENARKQYELALKINPQLESAILNYSLILEETYKEYDSAKKQLEFGILINPFNKKFHLSYGVILREHFYLYSQAAKHFEYALRLDPNYIKAIYNLAMLYFRDIKDYTKAEPLSKKLIEIDLQNEDAYGLYIDILTEIKKLKEAKAIYERVLKTFPDSSKWHYRYALFLLKHFKNYKLIKKHFERAIQINNEKPEYHNAYGSFLENQLKLPENAFKEYQKALQISPQEPYYTYNNAFLFETFFHDYEKARFYYEETIKNDSNFYDALNNLALLLVYHFKEYDKAKSYLEQAIKSNPTNSHGFISYAKLLSEHYSDFINAENLFIKGLEINPNDDKARVLYAEMLSEKCDKIEEANRQYEIALTINPTSEETISSFTLFCMQNNKYDSAKKWFEIGLKHHPNDDVLNLNYATLLLMQKDYLASKKHFEISMQLDSQNPMTFYNYAMLLKETGDIRSQDYLTKAYELDVDSILPTQK